MAGAAGGASPSSRATGYAYTKLADAMALPQGIAQCHLFGVMTECTQPRPTRGTDWAVNVSLVDSSSLQPDSPALTLEVVLFGGKDQLPQPREVGDIIRLHRVKVDRYKERPSFVAKLLRPTSFALFSRSGPEEAPYQKSSQHYSFDAADAMHLAALRRLGAPGSEAGRKLASLDAQERYKKSITDLAPDSGFVDLMCRVLHVHWPDASALPAGAPPADFAPVVWVWDGTDAKPLLPAPPAVPPPAPAVEGAAGLKERPLPLAEAAAGLPAPAEAPPPAEAPLLRSAKLGLGGVPPIGTALPLIITPAGAATFTQADLPPVGAWIKLRNVGVAVCGTQLQALYSAQSKWTRVMAVPDDLVRDAAKRLRQSLLSRWAPADGGPPALAASVTKVPPHISAMPLSTLREVLARPAPYKFRCLVRFTAHLPSAVEEFAVPRAAADGATSALAKALRLKVPPQPPGASEHLYQVRFRLEDATGVLPEAILTDEDGDAFFSGVPACHLAPGSKVGEALRSKVARLMDQSRDGGQWAQVCLVSYVDARVVKDVRTPEAQMVPEAKRFRIVSTMLP